MKKTALQRLPILLLGAMLPLGALHSAFAADEVTAAAQPSAPVATTAKSSPAQDQSAGFAPADGMPMGKNGDKATPEGLDEDEKMDQMDQMDQMHPSDDSSQGEGKENPADLN